MALGNLTVTLNLVANQYLASIKQAQSASQTFANQFKPLGRTIQEFGVATRNVGLGLSAAITLPLVAVGRSVIKTGIDFETAFSGVRKTVTATTPELEKIRQEFRDLAKEIPISAVEIANIGATAGALGIHVDDITAFTKQMAILGATTNLSSEEAATATGKFQNIFGAAGKDVDRFASTLVRLGNEGASTEQEIVEMGLRIAGAGHQVGLTQAQVLGFSSALASLGIRAEHGGSAISRVFLRINKAVFDGGEKLKEFARIAGTSTGEFAEKFRNDAAGATIDVIEGFDRLKKSGENIDATMEGVVGKSVLIKQALNNMSGSMGEVRRQVELGTEEWAKNEAAQKEFAERVKTTESQLKLLKAQFIDIGITLFDAMRPVIVGTFIPALRKVGDALAFIANQFAKLPQPVKTATVVILGAVATIGPALAGIGYMAQGIGMATVPFTKLVGMLTGPAGLAAATKTTAAATTSSAAAINSSFAGIGFAAQMMGLKAVPALSGVSTAAAKATPQLGTLATIAARLGPAFAEFLPVVIAVAAALAELYIAKKIADFIGLTDAVKDAWKEVKRLGENLQNLWADLKDIAVSSLTASWEEFQKLLENLGVDTGVLGERLAMLGRIAVSAATHFKNYLKLFMEGFTLQPQLKQLNAWIEKLTWLKDWAASFRPPPSLQNITRQYAVPGQEGLIRTTNPFAPVNPFEAMSTADAKRFSGGIVGANRTGMTMLQQQIEKSMKTGLDSKGKPIMVNKFTGEGVFESTPLFPGLVDKKAEDEDGDDEKQSLKERQREAKRAAEEFERFRESVEETKLSLVGSTGPSKELTAALLELRDSGGMTSSVMLSLAKHTDELANSNDPYLRQLAKQIPWLELASKSFEMQLETIKAINESAKMLPELDFEAAFGKPDFTKELENIKPLKAGDLMDAEAVTRVDEINKKFKESTDVIPEVERVVVKLRQANKSNAEIMALYGSEMETASRIADQFQLPLGKVTKEIIKQESRVRTLRTAWSGAMSTLSHGVTDLVVDSLFERTEKLSKNERELNRLAEEFNIEKRRVNETVKDYYNRVKEASKATQEFTEIFEHADAGVSFFKKLADLAKDTAKSMLRSFIDGFFQPFHDKMAGLGSSLASGIAQSAIGKKVSGALSSALGGLPIIGGLFGAGAAAAPMTGAAALAAINASAIPSMASIGPALAGPAAASGAGAGAAGAGAGAVGGGGLTATMAALLTNPITAALGAAIGAALAIRATQVHPTASAWTEGVQDVFDKTVTDLNAAVDAGIMSTLEGQSEKIETAKAYLAALFEFGNRGVYENIVARQALDTFKQNYGDPSKFGVGIELPTFHGVLGRMTAEGSFTDALAIPESMAAMGEAGGPDYNTFVDAVSIFSDSVMRFSDATVAATATPQIRDINLNLTLPESVSTPEEWMNWFSLNRAGIRADILTAVAQSDGLITAT